MSKEEYSKCKLLIFSIILKTMIGILIVHKCYLFGAGKINTIPLTPDFFLSFEINIQ